MNTDKIKRRIEKNQRLILILGILFTTYGTLRFLLVRPDSGINLKTLLPTVINGTEFIAIGVLLLIGWYLTRKNKDKIIETEIKELKEKKEKRKEHYNWGHRLK